MKHFNIFKRAFGYALALVVLGALPASAQLSGTYTIGGTSPDYATLSAAISALNSSGVSGPVTFMVRDGSYSGSSWQGQINSITGASATNRVTFTSQSNDKTKVTISASTSSSANYVFRFNNANFVTVKNLTLQTSSSSYQHMFEFQGQSSNDSVVNCVLDGRTSSSSSNNTALVYSNGFTGSSNVFSNNQFKQGGTWVYWRGSSTTTGPGNTMFKDNSFTNTSGYYGIYSYYTSGLKLHDNTIERSGSGTFYTMYNYYCNDDIEIINNAITASATSTLYGIHTYFANYYSNNATNTPKIINNSVTLTNSSGSTYPIYTYYSKYAVYENNVINATNTSGYIYGYGPLYYNDQSRASNNTFNYKTTTTGSSYIYNYYMCYNGANWADTFNNNTVNLYKTGSGGMYNYVLYYGNTIITNNTYDVYGGNSTTYNYFYYPNGAIFKGNKLTSRVNSATHYGAYMYNTTSYSGASYDGNVFDFSNNSGTLYGIYAYYWSGDKFMNNSVTSKTPSTNYTLRSYYNYNGSYYNNTFHSNATGSTNYTAYIYNSSASYTSKFYNNIFSRSGTNGQLLYNYNTNYGKMDYNLYHAPGGSIFYRSSPYLSTNSIETWKSTSGADENSLFHNPGYTDADNGNFMPVASNPDAWSVNGRGKHIDGDTMDVAGNPRARMPQDGVPDLGAYEFTPTSTPPACVASPAMPVANSVQTFMFGGDKVAEIAWGNSVPSNPVTIRQYTGTKANPINNGVGRMFFFTSIDGNDLKYSSKPKVFYKDPWIGNVSSETNAVIARSSAGGAWEGYNYTNANTDTVANSLQATPLFDSLGNYTGVENGRIGIRCVATPDGIKTKNITAISVDIEWNPVWNPIGYQVIVNTDPKTPTSSAGATQTVTNQISIPSGLQEDTKHYIHVRYICGAKDSSAWGLDSFVTKITCHEPDITLSSLTTDRVVISWKPVKTAEHYEYVINKSSVAPSFGTQTKTTSVLAPYLTPGVNYYIHARTKCNDIYEYSNWVSKPFQTWPLSVSNVSNNTGIAVYPNPVSDVLQLEVAGLIGNGAVVELQDITGKVVMRSEVTGAKMELNVSELPSGMYLLKYHDEQRNELIKVNKQ
ncbi:MAG: T9SS type A sorting domain-containing protein [Flavipsychrobacter sp.]